MTMFEIGFKCNKVAEHWGDRMPMLAMEEAGEFIQAISKYERAVYDLENSKPGDEKEKEYEEKFEEAHRNLVDEFGDMWISLMALQAHYGTNGTMADLIDKRIDRKLSKKY